MPKKQLDSENIAQIFVECKKCSQKKRLSIGHKLDASEFFPPEAVELINQLSVTLEKIKALDTHRFGVIFDSEAPINL